MRHQGCEFMKALLCSRSFWHANRPFQTESGKIDNCEPPLQARLALCWTCFQESKT